MSTDSTELTFVRCPSCRSLVPAVSTRCRMCGAALDPAAKVDEASETEKRTSRVRQKTMSQAHSELSSAAGQIREEMGVVPTEEDPFGLEEGHNQETSEASGIEDDPLGDYIQEMDEEPKAPERSVPAFRPAATQARSNGPAASQAASESRMSSTSSADARVHEARREQGREDRSTKENVPQRDDSKGRHASESPARQPGKPPGLSFSRGKEEQKREEPRAPQQNTAEIQRQQRQPEPPRINREPRRAENVQNVRSDRPAESANGHEVTEQAAVSNGRLFGWLVSFDKPEGNAIELREGKFFITGSQLKKHDLVISGKNLSTPHVMVSISRDQGFRVQDLMSESGTFVRRRSSQSYEREEGVVTLDHGDWVKFGNAEFVVAIVAYGK